MTVGPNTHLLKAVREISIIAAVGNKYHTSTKEQLVGLLESIAEIADEAIRRSDQND